MRLLYLSTDPGVPVLGHKGASVHVRAMVGALAAAGVEVVVASPRIAFEGERLHPAATLVEIAPVLPKSLARERSLRSAIERQACEIAALAAALGVDAVYERLALFSNGGVRTAEALGVPHALEVNAPLSAEAARFRSLPHPDIAVELEREVLGRTGRVLAVSHTLASLLADSGVEAGKIEVVGNGVSVETARALKPRRGPRFTAGFAGSLKPWHGIEVLLDGFALALRDESELELEIIGSGPLADLVRESSLPASSLRYRGRLTHDETLAAMAGWDVGLAPYPLLDDFYFSPLKVGEYMAAGACPVVSDLPVLRELLAGGERGVLVDPGDATALGRTLVALARDRDRTRSVGDRARAHALASLGWQRNAEAALAALRPLAWAAS